MEPNITIKRGEELLWQNTLKNKASGASVNLTGYTAYSQMRIYPGGQAAAEGECTIDAAKGVVLTLFPSTITELIDPGQYGFDVWLDLDGQKICIDTVSVTVIDRYSEEN